MEGKVGKGRGEGQQRYRLIFYSGIGGNLPMFT